MMSHKKKIKRISIGNKVIGLISLFSTILIALILIIAVGDLYAYIVSFITLALYSIQAANINYVELSANSIVISNVFRKDKFKGLDNHTEVSNTIFTYLKKISFSDGDSYFFWGISAYDINQNLKDHIKNQHS